MNGNEELVNKPVVEETPKRKRGRKPKNYYDSPSTVEPAKVVKQKGDFVECEACTGNSFKSKKDFFIHNALVHGGLAFYKGETTGDQTLDEEHLVLNRLRYVFSQCSQVKCHKCFVKSFGTFPGLKYHVARCGKSKEELDVSIFYLIEC